MLIARLIALEGLCPRQEAPGNHDQVAVIDRRRPIEDGIGQQRTLDQAGTPSAMAERGWSGVTKPRRPGARIDLDALGLGAHRRGAATTGAFDSTLGASGGPRQGHERLRHRSGFDGAPARRFELVEALDRFFDNAHPGTLIQLSRNTIATVTRADRRLPAYATRPLPKANRPGYGDDDDACQYGERC